MTDIGEVSVIRSFAERLLGPLVFAPHIPEVYGGGKLTVSGKVGGLKYLFGRAVMWDPELLRVASALVKKVDVVWDIGANVRLFSKTAAYLSGAGGSVYAIEADADAQVLLNRSIFDSSPKDAPITLLPVGVSNQVGWETFSISRRARASNSLAGYGSSSTGGVLQNRTVPVVTLDSLLYGFPPPNVLEIDVEGAELKVLEGGGCVLKPAKPLIYGEISDDNLGALEAIFKKYSYKFLEGNRFSTIADLSLISNRIGFNTVAMPEELLGC